MGNATVPSGPASLARPTSTNLQAVEGCPSLSAGTGARFSAQEIALTLTWRRCSGVLPRGGPPGLLSQFLSHSPPSGAVHQCPHGSCSCDSRTVADAGIDAEVVAAAAEGGRGDLEGGRAAAVGGFGVLGVAATLAVLPEFPGIRQAEGDRDQAEVGNGVWGQEAGPVRGGERDGENSGEGEVLARDDPLGRATLPAPRPKNSAKTTMSSTLVTANSPAAAGMRRAFMGGWLPPAASTTWQGTVAQHLEQNGFAVGRGGPGPLAESCRGSRR